VTLWRLRNVAKNVREPGLIVSVTTVVPPKNYTENCIEARDHGEPSRAVKSAERRNGINVQVIRSRSWVATKSPKTRSVSHESGKSSRSTAEMADEEAFDDQHQFQDFLSLLMRHWKSIVCILEKGAIFDPCYSRMKRVPPTATTGHAGAVTAIYGYFAPQRRRKAAAGLDAEGTANRQAKLKI
jgi:hypothetical protein